MSTVEAQGTKIIKKLLKDMNELYSKNEDISASERLDILFYILYTFIANVAEGSFFDDNSKLIFIDEVCRLSKELLKKHNRKNKKRELN